MAASQPRVGDELRTLRRSRTDRVVAGVLGGVGRQLGIDPVVLRVTTAVLAVFGGVGILLYAIGWLLIPADDEPGSVVEQALGRREPRTSGAVPLAIVLTIVTLVASTAIVGGSWDGWFLLVLAAIGLMVLLRRRDEPSGSAPAEPTGYEPPYAAERWSAPWSAADAGSATTTRTAGQPSSESSPAGPPPADDATTDATDATGTSTGTDAPAPTPTIDETPSPPESARATDTTNPTEATNARDAEALERELGVSAYASSRPNVSAGWPEGPDWGPTGGGWEPEAPRPRDPEPAPPRSVLGPVTVFAAIICVGVLAINDVYWATVPIAMYFAVALAVVGIGLLVGTRYGRARGLVALGVVLGMALVSTTAIERWGDGVTGADTTVVITDASQIPSEPVNYGAGDIRYDLSGLVLVEDDSLRLSIDQGAGDLEVIVPPNADVIVNGSVGAGDISAFGQGSGGLGRERRITDNGLDGPGGGTIQLDLELGFGDIRVTR
ncbi:MAG TPA: PspC domain-containing protein [Jiangellaceae bacterium]